MIRQLGESFGRIFRKYFSNLGEITTAGSLLIESGLFWYTVNIFRKPRAGILTISKFLSGQNRQILHF